MSLIGIIAYCRTGSIAELAFMPVAIAIFLVRFAEVSGYRRRSPDDGPEVWQARFTICAWLAAASWGAASFVVVFEHDVFVHFLVITVQSGFLIGAAARNSAIPRAALGQINITLIPLFIAAIATLDLCYAAVALFVPLHIAAARMIALRLGRNMRENLVAQEVIAAANLELAATNGRMETANEDLHIANARLTALVTTDGLTGLANRRGFDTLLEREWGRAHREHQFISLLMIDIDYFKRLNDTQGHPAGDDCLRRIAACLSAQVWRPGDVVARYGGEEFAVILPDADPQAASRIAGRLRASVERLALPHSASPLSVVTASIGAATLIPGDGEGPGHLLERADRALYAAKLAGRNRVSLAFPAETRALSFAAD